MSWREAEMDFAPTARVALQFSMSSPEGPWHAIRNSLNNFFSAHEEESPCQQPSGESAQLASLALAMSVLQYPIQACPAPKQEAHWF